MENKMKELGMSAFDLFVAAISAGQPIAAVFGAAVHSLDTVLSAFDLWNAKKIDRFINGINRDEKASENFRKLLFDGEKRTEYAGRIISNIFQMETERKVDYLIFAGINFSNDAKRNTFTEGDFFRTGFVLANTLSEDLKFLYRCDLDQEFEYNENIQGLVSAGLMYPSTDDKYRFTTFAKKLDFFALDIDGTKYGIDSAFSPLATPLYAFHARFA